MKDIDYLTTKYSARELIQKCIEQKCKDKPEVIAKTLSSTLKTKFMVRGINVEKILNENLDSSKLRNKIVSLAFEMGISIE